MIMRVSALLHIRDLITQPTVMKYCIHVVVAEKDQEYFLLLWPQKNVFLYKI